MDILTERGRTTVTQELEAADIFERNYPSIIYNHTPKGLPAVIDAVLTRKKNIVGVVETKCRVNMDLATLMRDYNGRWLVTNEKIIKAIEVANILQVPFVGFLYFPNDKQLLFKRLWTPEKGWCVNHNVIKTTTQATVNGGTTQRYNAFIDMTDAEIIE